MSSILGASHTPPQFFVEPSMVQGDVITLMGEALKHARAQRLRPGEVFRAVAGDVVYTAVVTETSTERVLAEVTSRTRAGEAGYRVHLFASILKGQNFDLVVEKATEIGAYSITPVISARTIPRMDGSKAEERRSRWQKVAKAASEQSGRSCVPVVNKVTPLTKIFDELERPASGLVHGRLLLAHEHPEVTVSLSQAIAGAAEASILVGPEGGFDETEVERALACGFLPISLGPHIMKAETASIAAVTLLVHYLSTEG